MSSCQEAAHGLRRLLAQHDGVRKSSKGSGEENVLDSQSGSEFQLKFHIYCWDQVLVYFLFAKVCGGNVIGFNTLLIKLDPKERFFLVLLTPTNCFCFDYTPWSLSRDQTFLIPSSELEGAG